MSRFKDENWNCGDGRADSVHHANLAVLMDIRDELKKLNTLLHCPNFVAIPERLSLIERSVGRLDKRIAKARPLK